MLFKVCGKLTEVKRDTGVGFFGGVPGKGQLGAYVVVGINIFFQSQDQLLPAAKVFGQ